MRTLGQLMAERQIAKLDLRRQHFRDIREERDHCEPPFFFYENQRQRPEEIKPVFRPRPIDKELDQLKGQVNFLTNKLAEARVEKKKPQAKRYGYKGIK